MIFAARQLHKKCQEIRTHLYTTLVDLAKAVHTVNREGLWKIMQKFGCTKRFTQLVRQLHDGMMARVTDNGAVSEAFAVTNGVKQGCILALIPFSLVFFAMPMDAYRDERHSIRIAYRVDGHLLNQRRMHFQLPVSTNTVNKLLFVDVSALNVTSERDMQRSMDLFSAACDNIVPVINTEMLVVMHQPPSDAVYNVPQINVKCAQLQVVDNFTYLGNTLSAAPNSAMKWPGGFRRPVKPSAVLKAAWNRHGLQLNTKPTMHKTVLLLMLLYRTETRTVYKMQAQRLNHLHLSCLRWILKLRWQDGILDTDILERTGIVFIQAMLRQLQLHWRGHLTQMADERLPKRLSYGDIATGSRRQ
ncbi:hypothetical protein SprV_0301327800 [Sparganum proliferum]